MTTSIYSEIKIKSPKEHIWGILMDFEKYPEWNPFIKFIRGNTTVGGKLEAVIADMKFKPTVLVNENNKQFKWLGKFLFTGLFDGAHRFELIETTDGVTFVQSEEFKGILVPIFNKMLRAKTAEHFKAMNQALKSRAEAI